MDSLEMQQAHNAFLEDRNSTLEMLALIDKRGELTKKKSVYEDKLKILLKYTSQKNYTSKVDTAISNLEGILLQQPDKIEKKKEKLDKDIESIEDKISILKKEYQIALEKLENKLEAKQKERDETTMENDSYTKYLESQIAARKEEREQILEKHKSKEQITAEHQIEEIDKELEELNKKVKELTVAPSSTAKNKVIKTIAKEVKKSNMDEDRYKHDPSTDYRNDPYKIKPSYNSSNRIIVDEPSEKSSIHYKLLKNYSNDYVERNKRCGLGYHSYKEEFEQLPLEQQKKCWNLMDEDEIEALKESGFYPSWYGSYTPDSDDE